MIKNEKDPLVWELLETEHAIHDEWIDLRISSYRFPDGKVYAPFYTYSRKDDVVVVASDEEGRYICVKQYRQGIGKVTTEFPAGGIELQDVSLEDALAAAKRELLEETGYVSDEWKYMMKIAANATICDNYEYLFIAKNCRKVAGQSLDVTEFVNVERYTSQELEQLIAMGEFQQAMHIAAWLLSQR